MAADLRQHPVYPELVARYRAALMSWGSPGVQGCSMISGMSCREYCDRFISMCIEPITWSSDTTSDSELTQEHYEAAYREAAEETP